jgi:thiamine-monophosphate kinase
LSDIAAMGALPRHALVSLHLPPSGDLSRMADLARGLRDELRAWDTQVLGGNITRAASLAVEVSVLGEIEAGRALLRTGAREGDDVYVTGVPGNAAVALRCLETGRGESPAAQRVIERWRSPAPRIREARSLLGLASACIDVSDGLSADAAHVARGSRLDILFLEKDLPESKELRDASGDCGFSFADLRFLPSDDYELLFSASPACRGEIEKRLTGCARRVGHATKGSGCLWLEKYDGTKVPIEGRGWDHLQNSLQNLID